MPHALFFRTVGRRDVYKRQGLIFVEIAMLFKLEHWVLPVTVLTFAICLLNFREVFAMVERCV